MTRALARREGNYDWPEEPEGVLELWRLRPGNPPQSPDRSPRVLLVNAEPAAHEAVAQALPGLAIYLADSARRALEHLASERLAVAIVDASLPDGDGRDLCATVRGRGLTLPILMLSGLGQEADVVRGLNAGADDYVVKPFRPGELAARLRARLRQHDRSEHVELPVGDQLFRPGNQTLSHPGQSRPTRLTGTETALLRYLFHARGVIVRAEELSRHVWGRDPNSGSRTVEAHISRLRGKVNLDADNPSLLRRERGGYRLVPASRLVF